jgi:hypothetical protein
MDEISLNKCLNKFFGNKFYWVFAINELPTKIKYPAYIIFNTKPRSHPGEHWLAVYINKEKEAYFFDSYGLSPD